jgi:D-alanyl-D-alanine carboxypeptidase
MSRPEFVHARFGMEFWALDRNTPVFRLNEQEFFVPGSTTKLLTEGTALTPRGDPILVASGDPNLSNRIRPDGTLAFQNVDHSYDNQAAAKPVAGDPLAVVRELAAQVVQAGVRQRTGRLLVDAAFSRKARAISAPTL